MKHIIIGSGVVGQATGQLLEAHGEDVTYIDNNNETVVELKEKGKNATEVEPSNWDVAWVCTHEKDTYRAMPTLPNKDAVIVIRSTVPPIFFNEFDVYDLEHIIHIPEFLTEANPLDDTFHPDRIVIGSLEKSEYAYPVIDFFLHMAQSDCPIYILPHAMSSYIKLISNAWLSTQISFWNEMYMNLSNIPEYRQIISDIVTLDKRISNYGSKMIGLPFGGKFLPKDLDQLINSYNKTDLLSAVKKVNEEMKKQ